MKLDSDYVRQKFKILFEHSLDYIFVQDLKGNFIDANDRALATLGYTRQDLPNLSFKDVVDNDQMKIALDQIKELLLYGGQISPAHWKIKTREGVYRDVITYGVPIKLDDKIEGILGIAKDITEQKNLIEDLVVSKKELTKVAQELVKDIEDKTMQIKKSEEKFQKIYEAVPDVFFLVNNNSTILDFKGKEEDLYVPPDRILGQNMSSLLPPGISEQSIKAIEKTIETQKPVIVKYSLTIEGKERKFEARHIFYDTDTVAIFIRET